MDNLEQEVKEFAEDILENVDYDIFKDDIESGDREILDYIESVLYEFRRQVIKTIE